MLVYTVNLVGHQKQDKKKRGRTVGGNDYRDPMMNGTRRHSPKGRRAGDSSGKKCPEFSLKCLESNWFCNYRESWMNKRFWKSLSSMSRNRLHPIWFTAIVLGSIKDPENKVIRLIEWEKTCDFLKGRPLVFFASIFPFCALPVRIKGTS